MTKAKDISYDDLAATFRYEDSGKLFRLLKGGRWREVNTSKTNSAGYVLIGFKGELLLLHRIIYSLFYKIDLPAYMEIDHTNGNTTDNHICNLELVTHRGNQQNQKCHRQGHLCGTAFRKDLSKWQARICINNKQKSLGLFNTQEEAAAAYQDACTLLGVPA